jgi:hypothetical protein
MCLCRGFRASFQSGGAGGAARAGDSKPGRQEARGRGDSTADAAQVEEKESRGRGEVSVLSDERHVNEQMNSVRKHRIDRRARDLGICRH